MDEAMVAPAAPRARSAKTTVAVLLVLLFLAAFAAAFYFLGGVDLVSGLLGMGFPAITGSSPSDGSGSAAPAAVPSSTPEAATALQLPAGVDEDFAKRIYVEQLESQNNITKLVDGRVATLQFGKVSTVTAGDEIETTVAFKDKTSAKGVLGLANKQGTWYFVFISGKRVGDTGGDADSVASDTDDTLTSHSQPALSDRTVDNDVLNTILSEQAKNQDVFKGTVDGSITSISVDGVDRNVGTATLDVTLSGKNPPVKGRVVIIEKEIDGIPTWFITSFAKA